jgi:acetoin utilization deacetylase AcuC-like enzyme
MRDTWAAASASADCALSGAAAIASGARAAFALCRPPGHHASHDLYGGYCFLNNAAIAARALQRAGAARVAILDIDNHHGNGTQSIFYRDGSVFFASLHADPHDDYPYFSGHADESGEGDGRDTTINIPLPLGTDYVGWSEALSGFLRRISAYGPDALVVSLGVDIYEGDPISHFRIESDRFASIGEDIGRLGLPTLFAMEGGYAVEAIGLNVARVLAGSKAV